MLSRRGQDSQRRLDVGPAGDALPLEAEPHDLGGDERGLAVDVEGEDVAGDEEQPVDVLVEVGQHRVDQLVVLKWEEIAQKCSSCCRFNITAQYDTSNYEQ